MAFSGKGRINGAWESRTGRGNLRKYYSKQDIDFRSKGKSSLRAGAQLGNPTGSAGPPQTVLIWAGSNPCSTTCRPDNLEEDIFTSLSLTLSRWEIEVAPPPIPQSGWGISDMTF